ERHAEGVVEHGCHDEAQDEYDPSAGGRALRPQVGYPVPSGPAADGWLAHRHHSPTVPLSSVRVGAPRQGTATAASIVGTPSGPAVAWRCNRSDRPRRRLVTHSAV